MAVGANKQYSIPPITSCYGACTNNQPWHRFIVEHSGVRDPSATPATATTGLPPPSSRPSWQGRVLVHSLFESLCQGCFEKHWRRKISACRGIRRACAVMNWQTARAFEFKLMQVRRGRVLACCCGFVIRLVFVPICPFPCLLPNPTRPPPPQLLS